GNLAAIDGRTGRIAWNRRVPAASLRGGPIATAGGVVFRTSSNGQIEAYNSITGNLLWRFQTTSRPSPSVAGSPATYELDGEQYVVASMGDAVWAFKLGGKISSAPETVALSESGELFSGPVVDTDEIETTYLQQTAQEPGRRYFIDEYSFTPYRA